MESFVQLRKGRTPRRVHAGLDGLKDDELGRYGFTGRHAQLYRRNDPTKFRTSGPLHGSDVRTDRLQPTDRTDPRGEPILLYSNADCRISVSLRGEPMPFYARNVDADELFFIHRGAGRFETEFGTIPYRMGDYVYLPKGTTYRHVPDEAGLMLLLETFEELRVPSGGLLGRHYPFDPSLVFIPEPEVLDGTGAEEWEVRLSHSGEHTSIFYPHNPCDVEGWKGDNFPFRLNVEDYNVLTSESVHLPPTAHTLLQAEGVHLMHFLPRAAERAGGAERIPWYHRNVDYDEIAFYHGGSVFGVDMPPGLISHAPQGIHHGAPERVRERARRLYDEYDRVEWQVIAIDTRRRLTPSPAVVTHTTEAPEEAQL